ncbi:MAG: hypothetical protein ACYC46_14595 [Acidobacteriaceae bacterium]
MNSVNLSRLADEKDFIAAASNLKCDLPTRLELSNDVNLEENGAWVPIFVWISTSAAELHAQELIERHCP